MAAVYSDINTSKTVVGTLQKWPIEAGGRSPKGPAVAGTTVPGKFHRLGTSLTDFGKLKKKYTLFLLIVIDFIKKNPKIISFRAHLNGIFSWGKCIKSIALQRSTFAITIIIEYDVVNEWNERFD